MIRRVACCFVLALICLNIFKGEAYAENSEVFYRIETNDKKIALTFDDGPHPRITKKILDILDSYGVTATFFVIGQNVVNYPEAMELIANSGCEIGNHTYSHKRFGGMSREQMKGEFEMCRKTLYDDFGVEPTVMRPPEGFCSNELCTNILSISLSLFKSSLTAFLPITIPSASGEINSLSASMFLLLSLYL